MEMKLEFYQWLKDHKNDDPRHLAIKHYSDVFTGMTPITLLEKAVTDGMFSVDLFNDRINCSTVGQPPSEWNQNGADETHDAFIESILLPSQTEGHSIARHILEEYDKETLFEVLRAVFVFAGFNESRKGEDVV